MGLISILYRTINPTLTLILSLREMEYKIFC